MASVAATTVAIATHFSAATASPTPPVSEVTTHSFAQDDVLQLFSPSAGSAAPAVALAPSSPLRLSGIALSSRSTDSRALVQLGDSPARPYAVGATLPNGATVQRIERRSITIEHAGQTQQLELPKQP